MFTKNVFRARHLPEMEWRYEEEQHGMVGKVQASKPNSIIDSGGAGL